MRDSILRTIKQMLGVADDDTTFDFEIIMHINNALFLLYQLGVIPKDKISIENKSDSWDEILGDNQTAFEPIKSYIFYKVKLVFDPSTNSSLTKQIEDQIKELEWRLNVERQNYFSGDIDSES